MNRSTSPAVPSLSQAGRICVLVVGFLGWMFAGFHMSITQLTGQAAAIDLLDRTGQIDKLRFRSLNEQDQAAKKSRTPATASAAAATMPLNADDRQQFGDWKELAAQWFAWYQCAFLFGAAAGGLLFGALGDLIGRSRGMAVSILTYSVMSAVASVAQSPGQLLIAWFLACLGVGGMWPNGVALVSEAWAGLSRPFVAGVIGTAANVGIFLMSTIAAYWSVTPDRWNWAMQVGAAPVVLGLFAWFAVPESPRWLALRHRAVDAPVKASTTEVFKPPLLGITIIGIILATIPIIGGWGTANWMVPWAELAGQSADPPNPFLKANVLQARAITGIVSSMLGGWIASLVGRRRMYFFVTLFSLAIAQYIFWRVVPTDASFLIWVSALGFVSGLYFGWLPLCLPELFPTRVRSTGAGVSFNFGRILTAVTVFTAGALVKTFEGDYARIGRITSLLFIAGLIAICFAPDTSRKQLED